MQPERNRQRRARRDGIARAKMLLKQDLAWLRGYPVAIEDATVLWQPLPVAGRPEPAAIRVDAERIRRAAFTSGRLLHRFPEALPRVVGDVQAWHTRIETVLEVLKETVHRGGALPGDGLTATGSLPPRIVQAARRTATARPVLHPLIDALGWSAALEPEAAELGLTWVTARAAPLHRLHQHYPPEVARHCSLLLAALVVEDGPATLDPILTLLASPCLASAPASSLRDRRNAWLKYFKRLRAGREWPAPPRPQRSPHPAAARRFVVRAGEQPRRCRALVWQLCGLALPPDILHGPAAAEAQLEAIIRQALRQMRRVSHDRRLLAEAGAEAAAELQAFETPRLKQFRLEDILQRILATAQHRGEAEPLLTFLGSLPAGEPDRMVRATLLMSLTNVAEDDRQSGHRKNWLRQFLRVWQPFLKRYAGSPLLLKPWDVKLNRADAMTRLWAGDAPEQYFSDENNTYWRRFAAAVCELAPDEAYSADSHDLIDALVDAARDEHEVVRAFRCLAAAGQIPELNDEYLSSTTLEAALRLSSDTAPLPHILTLLRSNQLEPVTGREPEGLKGLLPINRLLKQSGWPDLLVRLLEQERFDLVDALHSSLSLLRTRGIASFPPGLGCSVAPAADRFHTDLHCALRVLQAISPAAGSITGRILGKHFPDPARLKREIAALRQRLAEQPHDGNLQARLANLQQRLDQPQQPQPQQLAKLERKLREAIDGEVARQWLTAIDEQLQADRHQLLGAEKLPSWMNSRNANRVLRGILSLKPRFRELGLRCLQAECREEVDWPASEPANRQWQQQMQQRGLQLEPWLTPQPPVSVNCPKGRKVFIGLETSHFETLCMGLHFQTCLSPDSFNFFSAISNAVDLNKRVLYARDARQRVVGRCLLAIGETGGLLTFNPYCHQPEIDFGELVATFAANLAASMGTVVVNSDNVSPLVAPDWYDDGSTDLGGTITSEGSPLRSLLQSATTDTLQHELSETLAPEGLSPVTLPFVLELRELDEHPELAAVLVDIAREYEAELPAWSLLRLAVLGSRCGQHELAARLITRHGPAWLKQHWWYASRDEVLRLLIEHNPSLALRVIRADRHAQSDAEDEANRDYLILAHENLGRHHLARQLRHPKSGRG